MRYFSLPTLICLILLSACTPEQRCYRDEDCPGKKICNADGECAYKCVTKEDCGQNFTCQDHECVLDTTHTTPPCDDPNGCEEPCDDPNGCEEPCDDPNGCEEPCDDPNGCGEPCDDPNGCEEPCDDPNGCGEPCDDPNGCGEPGGEKVFVCPEGMASIEDTYCIDIYEASKPDATAISEGSDTSKAVSQAGVRPWRIGDNNAAAEAACEAAGKRLCTAAEWEFSCRGVNKTVYGYGDTYDPVICNGLDTYGRSNFKIMPTGSFPACTNGWGVYDMSGNLWEHTANGSGKTVRGGAFNCVDSETNHKCSYIPTTWTPSAMGFRCCASGSYVNKANNPDEGSDSGDGIPQASHFPTFPDSVFPHIPAERDFFSSDARDRLFAQAASSSDTMTDAQQNMYETGLKDSEDAIMDALSQIAPIEDDELEIPDEAVPSTVTYQQRDLSTTHQGNCLSKDVYEQRALALWNDDEHRQEAIEILKEASGCYPTEDLFFRMLGVTYAKQGNTAWALRILVPYIENHKDDCEAIAWTAWIQSQLAMTRDSDETLSKADKCSENMLTSRLKLIGAFNAMSTDDMKSAQRTLRSLLNKKSLYASDAEAALSMSRTVGTAPDPNFSWSAELSLGYASNAISGSPNDPALMDKTLSSGLMDGELRLTLDPVKDYFIRPVIEGKLNGRLLFSKDTLDSSYIDLSMRLGFNTGTTNVKFGLWYSPESLIMHGGDRYNDGPLLFYTGHRAELDIELYRWLYLYAGYGHRTFRQRVRTRHEFDIGAGGRHSLFRGLGLTWGATYRQWFSEGDMYDLNGFNLTLSLDYRLHSDWLFKLNGVFSYDAYPSSDGYFTSHASRKDSTAKGTLQVWSPSFAGVRFGAQFKASRRWSSADDYDFQDYRGLISVKWNGDLYFYTPKKHDDDRYALPWDLETGRTSEHIRDIIRQDEDMQRSSSCLQN